MQRATVLEVEAALGQGDTEGNYGEIDVSVPTLFDALADAGMRIVHVDAKALRPGDEGHPATQIERAMTDGPGAAEVE